MQKVEGSSPFSRSSESVSIAPGSHRLALAAMRRLGLVVITAALVAAVAAQGAAAMPPLEADYQFQDSYASSVAGPGAIGNVGPGNAFTTEALGCGSARVLAFPEGSGLQLAPNPASTNHYSVVVLFRLADVSGYRRIYAPGISGAFTTDSGLYNYTGKLDFYDSSLPIKDVFGPGVVFANNAYAEVALSYDYAGTDGTVGFVNGVPQFSYPSTGQAQATALRFFKDNDSGGTVGEDSAGAVARIRIYGGSLSAADAAQIYKAGPLDDRCGPGAATVAIKRKVKVGGGRHKRLVVYTGIDAGCPGGGVGCGGIATVDRATALRPGAAGAAVAKHLGKATLSLAAGSTRRVKVRLSRRASASLRVAGKLKVRISVQLTPTGGATASTSRNATIRAPGSSQR